MLWRERSKQTYFLKDTQRCKALANLCYFFVDWAKTCRGRSCGSLKRHIFGFHQELLTRFGRGVGMGERDNGAKQILIFLNFKGAQGCKALANW